MSGRSKQSLGAVVALVLGCLVAPVALVSGQAPAAKAKGWVVPRTSDGKPDLQGNWTNETQTPLERMGAQGGTLTDEQAAAIEKRAQVVEEFRDKPSDPNRPAPPKGGESGKLAAPGQHRSSR